MMDRSRERRRRIDAAATTSVENGGAIAHAVGRSGERRAEFRRHAQGHRRHAVANPAPRAFQRKPALVDRTRSSSKDGGSGIYTTYGRRQDRACSRHPDSLVQKTARPFWRPMGWGPVPLLRASDPAAHAHGDVGTRGVADGTGLRINEEGRMRRAANDERACRRSLWRNAP
jgi:hypothetical protein